MRMAINVGLMVPINNTTFEGELLAWLPAGSTCTTLRIPRGKGLLTPETLPAYKAQALELAARFATMDIDVVAYGCTAAGFISGPAGDAQLARELATVTGKPVVTTARSMVLALQESEGEAHCARDALSGYGQRPVESLSCRWRHQRQALQQFLREQRGRVGQHRLVCRSEPCPENDERRLRRIVRRLRAAADAWNS